MIVIIFLKSKNNKKGENKMTLVRWNPVRDLFNAEREFGKLFKDFENRFGFPAENKESREYVNAVWMPLTDIFEDKDNYTIKADLPGLNKKDVKISFNNGELSISGERVQESENKEAKSHRIERTFGKYYRSFTLPKEIKADNIKADFKDGQLTITIPKAEEVKPKEIEISVN
jgi:HSP20 family protein